jgi:cytochrome d ubiquinol oxidase subunit I
MDNLTAARIQMAVSLGFHFVFAVLGVGLPLLMVIAEGLWLRRKEQHYLDLAKKWSKAAAILFAIGAVSGTALSFELGLLWPTFMKLAGPVVGPAFALEGYCFFVEAIFIALYIYGWNRLNPLIHWLCGLVVVAASGVAGIWVMAVNSWMQTPSGFALQDGNPVNVNTFDAIANPSWGVLTVHLLLASYMAAAFMAAAVYAWGMLKGRRDLYHRSGVAIAMIVGVTSAILQPIAGDAAARLIATTQPAKLATMEAVFTTQSGAPLVIGGIPDADSQTIKFGIEIPYGLSLLAYHDPNATITGLDAFPQEDWPPIALVHWSFDVMVGSGLAIIAISLWYWFTRWRKREQGKWLLRALVLSGVLAVAAMEAGWIVTEVGRQPWVIYNTMRTADAVTPTPGLWVTMLAFITIYVVLSATLVWLLRRLGSERPAEATDVDESQPGGEAVAPA